MLNQYPVITKNLREKTEMNSSTRSINKVEKQNKDNNAMDTFQNICS